MPNKNYEKGRRKEYKICDELKKKGFNIVQRTAGSKSPFDVIAINKKTKEISLIQVKQDNISEKKSKELLKKSDWLNNNFKVEFVIM